LGRVISTTDRLTRHPKEMEELIDIAEAADRAKKAGQGHGTLITTLDGEFDLRPVLRPWCRCLVAACAVAQRLATEKADVLARELVAMVGARRTHAEATGLSMASVNNTSARACERIGWTPPGHQDRPSLEELAGILSEDEPYNVVPIHRNSAA
jgi:hypothetical protein